jgi:hypothetical protein
MSVLSPFPLVVTNMLISHTTQMVSRDEIHNENKISSSISFTLKNENKNEKNTDLVLTSVKVYI